MILVCFRKWPISPSNIGLLQYFQRFLAQNWTGYMNQLQKVQYLNINGVKNWKFCRIFNFLPLQKCSFWVILVPENLGVQNFFVYSCRVNDLECIHIKFIWVLGGSWYAVCVCSLYTNMVFLNFFSILWKFHDAFDLYGILSC